MATDKPTPATGERHSPAPERRDPLRVPASLRRFAKAKPQQRRPGEREW